MPSEGQKRRLHRRNEDEKEDGSAVESANHFVVAIYRSRFSSLFHPLEHCWAFASGDKRKRRLGFLRFSMTLTRLNQVPRTASSNCELLADVKLKNGWSERRKRERAGIAFVSCDSSRMHELHSRAAVNQALRALRVEGPSLFVLALKFVIDDSLSLTYHTMKKKRRYQQGHLYFPALSLIIRPGVIEGCLRRPREKRSDVCFE